MSAPPPPPTLADREPLSHTRRVATRERDGALIGWQRAPGGTGGINEPGVHWWACDEQWAPATRENPAMPWPPFWSLSLFRGVVERRSGWALSDLDGVRRRAPKIAANLKIRQTGADLGRFKPMPCVCTHPSCEQRGKVQSIRADAAGSGGGLSCCYGRGRTAESLAKGARTLARRHGVQHIAEMAVEVPWLVPLFGPDDYTNNRTHLPYRCLRCGDVHQIRPREAIRGSAACGSTWAMPMANGRDLTEVSRMGIAVLGPEGVRAAGRRGGLVTGGGDCIFLQAQGIGRQIEGGGVFYRVDVVGHPGLMKLGISNDYDRRARQAGYYGAEHKLWHRDSWQELCAVESIRKRALAHRLVIPEGIEKVSTSEIFQVDREREDAEVELLVDALNDGMSPWELALSFMPDLTSAERAILEGAMS